MGRFMKSDRRRFERDVYDYAEALGLDHRAAKKQVIKARGFCGEEDYDSENSALGDEVDDSADILKRLGSRIWSEPKVLPSVEDAHTGQAESRPKSKTSPKKSPYFSADSKTTTPQKKRKANPDTEDGPEGKESLSHGSKGLKRTKHGSIGEEINASKTVDSERASKERNDSHITTACGASQGLENGAIVDFSDYKLTAQPQAAIESREPHVNDTKAARKAAKKARRTQERAKRDPQGKASHKDRISALEPKTEAEAHENWLRLNQQDPHEHGPALNQREEESAEKAKSGAAFVEKLSDDIRYVNEKQLQLYGQGGMKNEKQGIKDDLEDMKRTRDELKPADEQVQRSKGRKRKSAAIRPDDDKAHSRNAQNTSNANSTSMVHGKNPRPKTRKQAKEDF